MLRLKETTYDARLIIADVKRPLLGADFFRRHSNGQRLTEINTYLSCPCSTSRVAKTELAPIEQDSNGFRKVLQDFPALLQPTFSPATFKHGVQHHICTTGPPVHSRARRLAPDRLAAAREEFVEMEQMGIIRRSNSPWTSPLHIIESLMEDGTFVGIIAVSVTQQRQTATPFPISTILLHN